MTAAGITPAQLDELVRAAMPSIVIGLDVDGVLAPIVSRAGDATLTDGVFESLSVIADELELAIVSGRALADLELLFSFPDSMSVIGSHGLEDRSNESTRLDPTDADRLAQLTVLADRAAEIAGDGAWVEHKPASVVLHVREVPAGPGVEAEAWLLGRAAHVAGTSVKTGHSVIELMAVHTSKADAMADFRRRHGAATMMFVGDDVTDEEVFLEAEASDITVRVGRGRTAAKYRLDDTNAVAEWLQLMAISCTSSR